MRSRIDMLTIVTDDVPRMVAFYRDVLGFEVPGEVDENYVELHNDGVRFAICARQVLADATSAPSYGQKRAGQAFELAFASDTPDDVARDYERIVAAGATGILEPATMPWGQHAAFFADPDGNIHELFSLMRPEE